jgi:hypothetical protein
VLLPPHALSRYTLQTRLKSKRDFLMTFPQNQPLALLIQVFRIPRSLLACFDMCSLERAPQCALADRTLWEMVFGVNAGRRTNT